ncbi:hypothetical protein LCGC14_3018110 [marine sediment metagenome]|uniref:Uncharacterized protein n=1 Tax=marine sediment metagenome TaxID=412755 RepID=A0A0F8WWL8_9ZZZZ
MDNALLDALEAIFEGEQKAACLNTDPEIGTHLQTIATAWNSIADRLKTLELVPQGE